MSVSQRIYEQASTWLNELDTFESLEGFIDLPGYEWVELLRLDFGLQYVVAEVRPLKHSRGHELAFDVEALKAVRKRSSPPVEINDIDLGGARRVILTDYHGTQEGTPLVK
jgi:glutaredoxin